MRALPSWGIWFMIAHGALLIGATLGLGWRRHGLRRMAPVVSAMVLVSALVIAAIAYFGAPSPVIFIPLIYVTMGVVVWRNWSTWGYALGTKHKEREE